MVTTIRNVSATSVYSDQPIEIEVDIENDSGSTATIIDLLLQCPSGAVCEFTRNAELPATLANGATLTVPFGARFYASKNLDPATKVYQSFSVTAVAKTQVGSTYAETASAAKTVNAINPSYPSAAQIQGPTINVGALNLTSRQRSFMIPYLF